MVYTFKERDSPRGANSFLNPVALLMAKTLWRFGFSESKIAKSFWSLALLSAVGLNRVKELTQKDKGGKDEHGWVECIPIYLILLPIVLTSILMLIVL